jgi:diacylglycerol kinase (ATP)
VRFAEPGFAGQQMGGVSARDNLGRRKMRAAAIFGPGASPKHLRPFQDASKATWLDQPPGEASEADAILVLGGDGTVHRHLGELVRLRLPVLIVPCGSGNDFARALGLRRMRDAVAAWRAFAAGRGKVKAIDLGTIRPLSADSQTAAGEAPAPQIHYFCTVAGIGLSSEIAGRANRLPRWMLAQGGYALCLPPTLLRFKPFAVKISAAETVATANSRSPIFVAAFANAPAYGGGMSIAPRARLDDGRLDLCIVGRMHKLKLLALFPTVYFGKHLGIRGVEYFQIRRARLETERPLDIYADGEYVCSTPVEVGVASGALRVILPG